MTNEIQNDYRKKSHVGERMVLGTALGLIFGLLFMDGNIASGMALGLCFGLIARSIIDAQRERQ